MKDTTKSQALYIAADPFTFNDLELVKQAIEMFGFVKIFLDRKNRDSEYEEYVLPFSDRADIIKHDLRQSKISNYLIVPIDSTLQEAIQNEHVNVLALNFDYQSNIDFRMAKLIRETSPNVILALLKAPLYIERRFVKTLLDSDASMQIYKKYCSDYSFAKFKMRFMKKIALTGNDSRSLDVVQHALEEHDYKVVDVDKCIQGFKKSIVENEKALYDEVLKLIAKHVLGTFSNRIVIRGKRFFEFAMEKMFAKMIHVSSKYVDLTDDLMDNDEKASYSDYVLNGEQEDSQLVSDVVQLVNSKLKRL